MVWRRRNQTHAWGGVAYACNLGVDLMTWQLSALSRLGSLCHLDLNIVGVYQIFSGNTKPAGRDLFDGRAFRVSRTVGEWVKAFCLFTAFTGIRLTTQLVHRHRQRGVRFIRNAAEGHSTGREAFHDLLGRLHFFKRNRLVRPVEVEQTAKSQQLLILLIDCACKLFVCTAVV